MPRPTSPSSSEIVACEMLLLLARSSDGSALLCPSAQAPEAAGSPARRAGAGAAERAEAEAQQLREWHLREAAAGAARNAAWTRDPDGGVMSTRSAGQKPSAQRSYGQAQPHSTEKQARHQEDRAQAMHISKHARKHAPDEESPSSSRDSSFPVASTRMFSASQPTQNRASEGAQKAGAAAFFGTSQQAAAAAEQAEQYAIMQRQYDRELSPEAAAAAAAMRSSAYNNYAARMRSPSQEMYLPQIPSVGQFEQMGFPQYPAGLEYAQYAERYGSNFYNYAPGATAAAGASAGYPITAPTSMQYFGATPDSGYGARASMAAYAPEYGAAPASFPGWV